MKHTIEIVGDEVQYYFYEPSELGVNSKKEYVEWLKDNIEDLWSDDAELAYSKIYSVKIDGKKVNIPEECKSNFIDSYEPDCGFAFVYKKFKRVGEFETDDEVIDLENLTACSVTSGEYNDEPFELEEGEGAWVDMLENQVGTWWEGKKFKLKID